MSVRNLLEDIHAEPFPEFHHPLLMVGGGKNGGVCRRRRAGSMVFTVSLF
jgi:hypothetical protein